MSSRRFEEWGTFECVCPVCGSLFDRAQPVTYGTASDAHRQGDKLIEYCDACLTDLDDYETVCPVCVKERVRPLPVLFASRPTAWKIDGKLAVICPGCEMLGRHNIVLDDDPPAGETPGDRAKRLIARSLENRGTPRKFAPRGGK